LYNGDFEEEPTGSVFDWRLSPSNGIKLDMDGNVSHSGRRSLRVGLGGTENLSYGRVAQRTVVREGAYRLRAYAKTDGLSTDRGLAVRVYDAESPGRLDVRTEELRGTNEWRRLEKTFTAGRGTRLIEVQLSREPSLKFDNKIQGTLWLDGVTLERVPR
jgi:predicted secreted protein